MGFNMISLRETFRHILLRLTMIFLLIGASSSCMKVPEIDVNPGTPTTAQSVQQALLQAWGDVDPASIQNNEFSEIDQEQSIQAGDNRIAFQIGTTVLEKIPTETEWKFKLAQQKKEFTSEGTKLSSLQRDFSLPRTIAAINSRETIARQRSIGFNSQNFVGLARSDYPLSIEWLTGLLYSCVPTEDFQSSCFNLKSWDEMIDPPALIRESTNCGGLPDCKMRLKRVAFDVVVTTKEEESKEEKQKVRYNIAFAPEFPLLSRLYEYCFQGLISPKPNTPKILIKICNKVTNFHRGEAAATSFPR